ncbi:MAG: 16S rRNA (cytosine(1402)-N(4))-methyltransferase RsmH, partial [Pyrinomonadaceae bacterium]
MKRRAAMAGSKRHSRRRSPPGLASPSLASQAQEDQNAGTKSTDNPHHPVMLAEAIEYLAPQRSGFYVDATLGAGGHSKAILQSGFETRVLGIDRDSKAIEFATSGLAEFGSRFRAVHANFRNLSEVLNAAGEESMDGLIADLGVSSMQFDDVSRGFSFRFPAPLDMRMNTGEAGEIDESNRTVAELLRDLSEEEIARIIYEYGEERNSRRIARRIVERRELGDPVETTFQLAELVKSCVRSKTRERIHPATRTFQALRIAVNHELESLESFIETAARLLRPEGRLVIISFHSLEDRIVKWTIRRLAGKTDAIDHSLYR